MFKSMLLSVLMIGSSGFAIAKTGGYVAINGEVESQILARAQFCSYEFSFPGMVDSPRRGDLAYDARRDAFVSIDIPIIVAIYRKAHSLFVGDLSTKWTLKTYVLDGPTAHGLRLDYRGNASTSIYCYYMR